MKAIIKAAGKSTRTWPLTVDQPKALLKIINTTIIEHNLLQLKGIVKEAIIVVGFMKEKIIKQLGDNFKGIKLTYVEQKEQLGTGHAILVCESKINKNENIIILNSDDLFSKKDIEKLVNSGEGALAQETNQPKNFGIFKIDKDKNMIDIIEKPKENVGNLANTGCFFVNSKLIEYLKKIGRSERGEIELTEGIVKYVRNEKIQFKIVKVEDYWIPIAYPWSYLEANVSMLKKIKYEIKGKIEHNVTIKGDVYVGKGTIIKSGTYIEGPVYIGENCTIGPNAYIRPDTIIMDNVNTRAEIYDTVIMDNTTAKHNCYLGHSVLGENVNIGAGTITSDYRHDSKNHFTLIKGNKIDTKRRKLGAFIGDNVKTGIGTLIYPGRKLWPGTTTLPGEIIKKDKTE